ncbi:MAG: hypothetical protein ACREPM_12395 [Gemmatimonadaceae bacterium]
MTFLSVRNLAVGVAIALAPSLGLAQAATPPAATPGFDFSGVIFGNYQFKTDSASKTNLGGQSPNLFTVDRAYLTFKMPAGDNGAIRVTTDILQNTNPAQNSFYAGWVVRIKYAYLQYTGLRNSMGSGSNVVGRLGIVHTAVIDYEESLWPRYLQNTAIEKNGFFSSSDVGLAGIATLGDKWGEIYGIVSNGSSYSSYDNPGNTGQPVSSNRFKDLGLRVTLTPLAKDPSINHYIRYLSISPWGYLGYNASAFQSGGAGQVGPGTNGAITDGMTRNRFGLLAAIKDSTSCDFRSGGRCRLTAAFEYAQRMDQSDNGGNTAASPRVVHDSTGRLLDGFIFIRPLEVFDETNKSPFSVVARYDHFTPQTDPSSSVPGAANYAGNTPAYNFVLLGASWDLNQRITLTADYQQTSPTNFPAPTGTNVRPSPESTVYYLHFVVNF